jgi:DNA-3-methyladenine glycosylase II
MWAKLEAGYGAPPDLKKILKATDAELRLAGLSRQKAGYARSLAGLVLSGELNLDHLPKDDEEAIALLTKIKGIGRWSAEIYLLFAEGRADVWPAGDLAVQIEIGKLLGLEGKPTEKQLRELGEAWRPHRGAAAVLAWHSYNSEVL